MPYTAFDMIRSMQAQFDDAIVPERSPSRIVTAIRRLLAR